MIRVERGAKPAVLAANGEKWKIAIRSAKSPGERKKAQKNYQHRQIKEALIAAFHGKCAYCESAITHVDYVISSILNRRRSLHITSLRLSGKT